MSTSRFFKSTLANGDAPRRSARLSRATKQFPREDSPVKDIKTEVDDDDPPRLSYGSDIEDAITLTPVRSSARKRKRTSPAIADAREAAAIKMETEVKTSKTSKTMTKTTTTTTTTTTKPSAPRKARRPARKVQDGTGATRVEPPSDWAAVYEAVRRMRAPGGAASNAAVDTMGCERLADRGASARDRRFHTLVALMLSSQTKDTTNAAAMARLKAELPPHAEGAPAGLNLENILAVEPARLNELIWAVGFHNNKTKYIKQAALILRDSFASDIPDTIEGLTSLPGVGPKMAYLCMSAAWDRTEGIGVDVHVHRITNLWGWHATKTPEETRLALQAWLPRDRWREINWLLVGLGQAVCLPVGRRCGECTLGLDGLCRAAERKKVVEGRRRREKTVARTAGGEVAKVEREVEQALVGDVVVNEDVDKSEIGEETRER